MSKEKIESKLLSSVSNLRWGFFENHTESGKILLAKQEEDTATVKQVHGDRLHWVSKIEKKIQEADAVATLAPKLSVGVYSADCVPILFVCLNQMGLAVAVMAVHAGWRGTAQRIVEKAFVSFHETTRSKGGGKYYACLGPCIQKSSFEVGEEVVEAFPNSEKLGIAKFFRSEGSKKKYLFDLPGENMRQLEVTSAKLSAHSKISVEMESLSICTFQEKALLPSFRRDREKAGRLLSLIGFLE